MAQRSLENPPFAPAAPPHARESHLPALDGLRAVAVWIVIASHVVWREIPGGVGVTVFFFISGFIITRNCLEGRFGPADVLPFYVKRFFRLAPAVFAYIASAAIVAAAAGGRLPWEDIRATVFYYANYHDFSHVVAPHNWVSPLEMTWSLAVEEHFYLCFPLALLWARRPASLAVLLVAVIVAACLWRLWLFRQGADGWGLYAHTDTRLDSIAYGCLLSVLVSIADGDARVAALLRRAGRGPVAGVALAVLVGSLAIANPAFSQALLYTVQGLALMPVFCHLFFAHPGTPTFAHRFLASRFLTWTGRLSYSLYLFHVLGLFIAVQLGWRQVPRIVGCWAFAHAAAWASLTFVETPGKRVGRRLAAALRRPRERLAA